MSFRRRPESILTRLQAHRSSVIHPQQLIPAPKTLPRNPPIFTSEPVMTSDEREGSRGWEVAPIGRGELGSYAFNPACLVRTRENPGLVARQWPHLLKNLIEADASPPS